MPPPPCSFPLKPTAAGLKLFLHSRIGWCKTVPPPIMHVPPQRNCAFKKRLDPYHLSPGMPSWPGRLLLTSQNTTPRPSHLAPHPEKNAHGPNESSWPEPLGGGATMYRACFRVRRHRPTSIRFQFVSFSFLGFRLFLRQTPKPKKHGKPPLKNTHPKQDDACVFLFFTKNENTHEFPENGL